MSSTTTIPSGYPIAAIESLRAGIPPAGELRRFTVGRQHEIERLEDTLLSPEDHRGAALLIQANYGAGKTHLLRLIRELALDAGYAVAFVTVDSQSNVRFNRMDQVAGAVMRALEVDETSGKGAWKLFDAFGSCPPESLRPDLRASYLRISANGRWDFSEELKSSAMFVALRAWLQHRDRSTQELIRDWLSQPWEYRASRRLLYEDLILGLPGRIRDPRPESTFYADDVFLFHVGGHQQAWSALADLDRLARICGRKGLVLLFDEFEDVIQNMRNIRLEQEAFVNLFRLFGGERFPGMSYFAVTPEFSYKCRARLFERRIYDFPDHRFEELEWFEMSTITRADLGELARRIRAVHGEAYAWDAEAAFPDDNLDREVRRLYRRRTADQIRQAVEGVVLSLDDRLEASTWT
jgi:hypothetical protein